MADFNTEALQALGTVYRVQGGQVPTNRIDLGSAITLVHDVSRLVGIGRNGAVFGGFFNFSITNTHTIVGETASTTQSVSANGSGNGFWTTLGLNPSASWIWILELSVRINSTALIATEVFFNIQQAPYTGAFTSHQRLIWRSTTQTTSTMAAGAAVASIPSLDLPTQKPVLVTPEAGINFNSTASGANSTMTGQIQCWAGPRFVLPPGLS